MKSSMYFRTYLSKGKETKNIKYHDYLKGNREESFNIFNNVTLVLRKITRQAVLDNTYNKIRALIG